MRKKNGKTKKGDCQFNSWFSPSGVNVLSLFIQKFSFLRRIDRSIVSLGISFDDGELGISVKRTRVDIDLSLYYY